MIMFQVSGIEVMTGVLVREKGFELWPTEQHVEVEVY